MIADALARQNILGRAWCGSRDLTGNDAPTSSSEYTLLCLVCGEQHYPNT